MFILSGGPQIRSVWLNALFILAFMANIASGASPVCLELGGNRQIRPAFAVFSPDGKWIAASTSDEVVLWDFATKEKVATFKNRREAEITFSPDSQRLVCLDIDGCVSLWEGSAGWADAAERVLLSPAVGPDGRQETAAEKTTGGCISISPDGTVLAVARKHKGIELVAMDTGKSVGDLESERPVDSGQFADQGKLLVVATGGVAKKDQIVEFWNVETLTAEEPLRTPPPPLARFGVVNLAALSPTEKLLALTMTDWFYFSEVRLFELPSRRWVTLTSNSRPGFWPAFSPDGRLLAVPTHRGPADPAAVLLWDVTARTWRRLDCPPEVAQQNLACFNAKFSPDGRYVAAGLTHPQIAVCIWDLQAPEASTGESGSWSGSSLPTPNWTSQGGTAPDSPKRQARQRSRR